MAFRILIAAGGTAGHVAPALAVADELRGRGAEVIFAGTPGRMEATMVPAAGYRFEPFRVSGFERRLSRRLLVALGEAAAAPVACGAILRRVRPDAVLGGGGYVAGPMVAAAAALRIPAAVTEADSHLGLANRLAAPLARRVLLAYPIAGLEPPKHVVVGRPVAPAFASTTREQGREAFGIAPDDLVLAVFGGSLGAGPLNAAVSGAYGAERADGPLVVHVTGRGKATGLEPSGRYRVLEYCDRMPELLASADLVVCRAGGSVWEVAAAGRAAVLVPWAGAAGDHQTGNARHFVAAGGAALLDDRTLTAAALRVVVDPLLGDDARRSAMAAAMARAARPDAAAAVADVLLELAAGAA